MGRFWAPISELYSLWGTISKELVTKKPIFSGSQKREPEGIHFRVFLVLRWRLGGVQGSLQEDLDYRISEGGLLRLRQSWRELQRSAFL